jgi:acetyltransferase-like isoleucine patch superfamily enzyme
MGFKLRNTGFILIQLINRFSLYLKRSYFFDKALIHESVKFIATARVDNILGDRNAISVDANTIIGGQLLTFRHGGKIRIGEWCYLGEDSRIWSADMVSIGSRVLISHGVNIHDTDSHPINAHERHQHFVSIATTGHPASMPNLVSKPIVIEDDVWIGCNALILKGVRIGHSSIIAAGSVVTKSVPEKVIVAGNPARIIRDIN